MSSEVSKYINYFREAFRHPLHLIGIGTAMAASVLLAIIASPALDLGALPFIVGGLDLAFLGIMSRNPRFIRAINSKYQKEITAFEKAKSVTGYYNNLSGPRQRRFEHFKKTIDEIKENFRRIHGGYPEMINAFLSKISNLQLTYVRLLYMQDKFPTYLETEKPEDIQRQIDQIRNDMGTDSPKLKEIKMKRIKLMEKRIQAYGKAVEHKEIITAQLQTIEEMVQYIKDQPVVLKNTDSETSLIDNVLQETEQMQDTITDLEAVMNTDFTVGDYGDMGINDLTGSGNATEVKG